MKYKDRFKISMIVFMLPIISYGILGPLEIYFGNEKDFSFLWKDFFVPFLCISFILWIVGSLIFAAFPEKINRCLCVFVLSGGVASYVQNMFMNIKLSENDGGPMKWDELNKFTIINLIIWIVIIVIFICMIVFLKKYREVLIMGISAFLSAIQMVAVISLVIPALFMGNDKSNLQISTSERFNLASKDNIVIFILDTLGNGQFEKALAQYPDLLDNLSDFTYYNNADCHYYCTFPSLTHMFTGNEFDFDSNSEDWLAASWESEKSKAFYKKIHNNKYICNLYSPFSGYVYGDIKNLAGKFDNVKPVETDVDYKKLITKMGEMSVYRYVPYILKPHFEVLSKDFDDVIVYKEGDACIDDNGEFYKLLLDNSLHVDRNMEKAIIIQHLFGTHAPYTIDEKAEIVEESDVNSVIKGLSVIVNEYISQMIDLGVYDDSTIIIMSDHGSWYLGDTQPIFFIKQKHENHDKTEVNTAPISLDDMQATILSIIGEDYNDYGNSIFDWKEGQQRERTVYMRITDDNYPSVQGSAWNVYYGYTYMTNKDELNEKVEQDNKVIYPATPWIGPTPWGGE